MSTDAKAPGLAEHGSFESYLVIHRTRNYVSVSCRICSLICYQVAEGVPHPSVQEIVASVAQNHVHRIAGPDV